MKSRNYHYYGDATTVKRLREEFEYIGRYCEVEDNGSHLIVFALPPRKEPKKKNDTRGKSNTSANQDRGTKKRD